MKIPMRKEILIPAIICLTMGLSVSQTSAQLSKLDSMVSILPTLKNDSNRVLTLARISIGYRVNDVKTSLKYARQALEAAQIVEIPPRRLGRTYNAISATYIMSNLYDSAEVIIKLGLKFTQGHPDLSSENRLYNSLGILNNYTGKYTKAIECFLKAIDLARQANEPIHQSLGSIATSYKYLKDHKKSVEYNLKAIEEAERANDQESKYLILANLAAEYMNLGEYGKARPQMLECVQYHERTNNLHALTQDYLSLASLSEATAQYQDQLRFSQQAVNLTEKTNTIRDRSAALLHLGTAKYFLHDPIGAQTAAEEALQIADSTHQTSYLANITSQLAKIALYNRDIATATNYFQQSDSIKRVANIEQQETATTEIMTRYDTEKKELENQALKKDQAAQKQVTTIIILSLIIVLIFLAILFILLRKQRRANKLLNEKNNEIREQREEIVTQNEEIEKQNKSLTQTLNELNQTQAQLLHSEKMASLGQLTAGITHEINNPLNFIKQGIENLEDSMSSLEKVVENYSGQLPHLSEKGKDHTSIFSEMREFSKIIHMGSVRTSTIISGLRKFSYKGVEVAKPADIREVIEDTLMLIRGVTAEKIKVTTEFEPNLRPVSIKPLEIGQALLNVLMNSTQSISGNGTISIHAGMDDSWLAIRIQDSGSGIHPENLKKIFDPFFTTKDVGQGTGLGLSITHGIIANHGGTIRFESMIGEGTTCYIRLPA